MIQLDQHVWDTNHDLGHIDLYREIDAVKPCRPCKYFDLIVYVNTIFNQMACNVRTYLVHSYLCLVVMKLQSARRSPFHLEFAVTHLTSTRWAP